MKRRAKKLPYIPHDDDVRRIIEQATTQRDRLILLSMYMVGLRVSEVVKLEVQHLDFKRQQLFLYQAKGGKDAYLPIPRHLAGPLRGFVAGRADGPVFVSRKGGRLKTRAVQLLVKKYAAKAGLAGAKEERRYTPHKFPAYRGNKHDAAKGALADHPTGATPSKPANDPDLPSRFLGRLARSA